MVVGERSDVEIVMTEGGPWRARRLAQGDAAMTDLANRFAAKYGGMGSVQYGSAPLSHRPAARVVVLRRRGGCGCGCGCGGEAAGPAAAGRRSGKRRAAGSSPRCDPSHVR
ncbi:hypothetical protein HXX76_008279 [Chlamydomonas incerta]|uniref:Uncharacterized protein n=1 Tax=Chlamydomonas incerta TaxID=51695 RepID=A0A835SV60_CHLIN|nr:hypothetical protein HXX76_016322 [Chlamydomonas incerta]KAG2433924.1 hypothetical protein HXX76_008276 [Chlamydomonas incerta]KAG2433925.1 hypothetical protein HXX76_008277 [Chlamydomonas incerta]KAG2433927.1 hypothetical protein HXX76_008279 [Chlamydomonas incerta]|eukprot:KAG2422029.1 hypothetical protein HXX76_016322 [Chlamydomonas incerta]